MSYPINPDRNQPWNALPELPLAAELVETVEILSQLVKARAALGRLQGRSAVIPNQGLLVNSISLQEAKASSAIENIFTTDDELYKAYSEQATATIAGAPKEVLRYREALWHGHAYLQERPAFDLEYFPQMYRQITQATDGIRPPLAQVYLKQGGSGPNAGKAAYTPPRGAGILEAKLANLLDFLNDDARYPLDPVLKMAIGHFQFEAIHPFRDGNGRTGRVFNIHYLTQKGLLDYPILFLSRYIMDHKADYYALLSGVSQRGDWKSWILYMLRAVETTANLTYDKINDLVAAKDAILQAIVADTAIERPEQLVNSLFTQPFTKVKHLTDARMYVENTARKYLNQLVDMGVLGKKVIAGHHYYLNLELHRILSE
ncbi:Fic family protein [Hymenobacter coccineus]|uniref:Cell filamentation protein Fic n=1 Tax=Hymenobacter coccineus TaxID=1908235 RepID=A0A1G1TAS8_9BACT|nr:Fic family protein [Hymenobacter coccineus]OGX87955.1 cell filamentation protein Fic [Hymenobacter coccineus]